MSPLALRFEKRKKAVELKAAGREESSTLLYCGLPLRAPNMGNHLLVLDM